MTKTTRTTLGAVVIATATLLAMTTPVLAGRPGKPAPPEIVSVTMNLVDGQGLSTDCSRGAILMERTGDELFPSGEDQIGLSIHGIDTSRWYSQDGKGDVKTPGDGFDGCHGGDLDGNDVPYGGFGITVNDVGEPTDVLWHFDYYLKTAPLGKNRIQVVVMEHFTLSSHDVAFDPVASQAIGADVFTGTFNVLYHLEERGGDSVDYREVEGSPVELSFTFEMQPQG